MGKPYDIQFNGYSGRYDGNSPKDERFINCFRIKDGNNKYIVKRPGIEKVKTITAGNGAYGLINWKGINDITMMVAYGNPSTVYRIATNTTPVTTSSVGAITGVVTSMSDTYVGSNTPTITVTSSDNTAWYYDNAVTVIVMTKIADADFPGNAGLTLAGGFAHMDGYAFVMDSTGKIWNSDLNSITSWTATSFVSANSFTDLGKGCFRFKNYIIAFGANSMEFFQNAGTATGSPLVSVPSMTQKVGIEHFEAVSEIGGQLFFIGKAAEEGIISLYKFDGSISRASTPAIDAILNQPVTTYYKVSTFRNMGRSFVVVYMTDSSVFVYCVEENEWWEYSSALAIPVHCATCRLNSSTQYETFFVGNETDTSGNLYKFPATPVYKDDSSNLGITIQSAHDDLGTSNRKFYGDLSVQADIASGSCPLLVYASDDDGVTYNSIGSIDLANNFPLFRTGASVPSHGNKRSWQFTNNSNVAIRINKFQFPDVRIGTK